MKQPDEANKIRYYWQSADEYLEEYSNRLRELEVHNYANRYADKEAKDMKAIKEH